MLLRELADSEEYVRARLGCGIEAQDECAVGFGAVRDRLRIGERGVEHDDPNAGLRLGLRGFVTRRLGVHHLVMDGFAIIEHTGSRFRRHPHDVTGIENALFEGFDDGARARALPVSICHGHIRNKRRIEREKWVFSLSPLGCIGQQNGGL